MPKMSTRESFNADVARLYLKGRLSVEAVAKKMKHRPGVILDSLKEQGIELRVRGRKAGAKLSRPTPETPAERPSPNGHRMKLEIWVATQEDALKAGQMLPIFTAECFQDGIEREVSFKTPGKPEPKLRVRCIPMDDVPEPVTVAARVEKVEP